MNVIKKDQLVTPEEFEAMEKDDRFKYELMDGVVMMSPRPALGHQMISLNLASALKNVLKGTNCVPLLEVDLFIDGRFVVPDIMIACEDKEKLQEMKRYEKPPLIVIEIISPSSASYDHITKRHKYETFGVKEYWIVSPEEKCVTVLAFEENFTKMYCDGQVTSVTLPEITITLSDIFA